MDPPLAAPLRLRLDHADVPISDSDASVMIRLFLQDYATRTSSLQAEGSTGGVIASQLTRLMNGLNGVIVEPPLLETQHKEETIIAESQVGTQPEAMEVDEPTQTEDKVEEESPSKQKKKDKKGSS